MHGLVGDCALLGIHKQEGGLVSATMIAHTIAEQVGDALRAELLAGEHGAGTPLREEELATRFGVSRHPIRKVLQQLTLEGLLTSKANCGVVVADSTAEHVQGLLTPMRQQLELYALGLALQKLTPALRAEGMGTGTHQDASCGGRSESAGSASTGYRVSPVNSDRSETR